MDNKNSKSLNLYQKCLKAFYTNKSIVLWKTSFSPYLCGFRKNQNVQYSLLEMIENWKKQLDNDEKVEVIFMDLPKAFDMINYSLLLAKVKSYSFLNQALSLLQSYLSNKFQRSIINGSFSSWNEVITGLPRG